MLTAAKVRAAKPAAQRYELADGGGGGLRLVVQPSGSTSWAVRCRLNGKQLKITLGRYPAMSLSEARAETRRISDLVARGIDPRDKRDDGPRTLAALFDDYERLHLSSLRGGAERSRLLRRELMPVIGELDIAEIRRRDIVRVIDRVRERGADVLANRVLAAAKALLNWAVERDEIEASAASRMKLQPERSRDRTLNDNELAAVLRSLPALGWPFGAAFHVLILTGQRRGEVGRMRWADIDLDGREWRLTAAQTKAAREHVVPLAAPIVDLLRNLPRFVTAEHVFVGAKGGSIKGWASAKERLDKLSGVTGWTTHDLRRTAATGMARLGVRGDVIKRVLNHAADDGVTGIYNRYKHLDEMRETLEKWSKHVEEIEKKLLTCVKTRSFRIYSQHPRMARSCNQWSND